MSSAEVEKCHWTAKPIYLTSRDVNSQIDNDTVMIFMEVKWKVVNLNTV
jgi:hypothetical protein